MKLKKLCDTTSNRAVLNRAYKLVISREERICNFCPYHRGENALRKRKDRKNWKQYRKTQWKQQTLHDNRG